MVSETYQHKRDALETYFDRTASETWERLTSDAPVSRIRATVRAGRDRMRATLLSYLPERLADRTLLDAGCGTGAFAVEASARRATVVAVDIAPSLIAIAGERTPPALRDRIDFQAGDMLARELGTFDHVVAMDSLIHYRPSDMVAALAGLAARTQTSLLFTFAPRTPLLTAMHMAGKAFPKSDRSPAIVPVREATLRRLILADPAFSDWRIGRTERVASGFYTSQAMELLRREGIR